MTPSEMAVMFVVIVLAMVGLAYTIAAVTRALG